MNWTGSGPDRSVPPSAGSNPFATRFIQPAAMPYRFPEGHVASELVDRLQRADWNGQIVGPHGSGKSTLLETLVTLVLQRDRRVAQYHLHDGQRCLPAAVGRSKPLAARDRCGGGWLRAVVLVVALATSTDLPPAPLRTPDHHASSSIVAPSAV